MLTWAEGRPRPYQPNVPVYQWNLAIIHVVRMFDVICSFAPLTHPYRVQIRSHPLPPVGVPSPLTVALTVRCRHLQVPQKANYSKPTHHRALCQSKNNDFEWIILIAKISSKCRQSMHIVTLVPLIQQPARDHLWG